MGGFIFRFAGLSILNYLDKLGPEVGTDLTSVNPPVLFLTFPSLPCLPACQLPLAYLPTSTAASLVACIPPNPPPNPDIRQCQLHEAFHFSKYRVLTSTHVVHPKTWMAVS